MPPPLPASRAAAANNSPRQDAEAGSYHPAPLLLAAIATLSALPHLSLNFSPLNPLKFITLKQTSGFIHRSSTLTITITTSHEFIHPLNLQFTSSPFSFPGLKASLTTTQEGKNHL
ncbi:hypothetical protein V6N13_087867 [Hibiscus sabdariffa]|uniref:Uncharacterized protein n=1 Tax=Hibiscus sabdariffa TaxID=183260 RepID=A0ABR2FXJ1_9ROSI